MLIVLVALAALTPGVDPEGVVATAPAGDRSVIVGAEAPSIVAVPAASASQAVTAHGLDTAQQIDRWIGGGPRKPGARPFADDRDPLSRDPWVDDRKIHGSVSAAIGTNDYSGYSAEVSIPFGDTGRVNLAYSQSRNDPYAYGYGYGRGFGGYGPRYGYGGAWGNGPLGGFGALGASDNMSLSVGVQSDRDARHRTPVWNRLKLDPSMGSTDTDD